MNKYHKLIFFSGIIIYLTLSFLAVLYYCERSIFSDAAFHLFYIIKDCKPAIQANRFGAIFTQMFPLIGAKLHLPLKFIMISYSEGFVLYNTAIFLLCFFLSKEKAFAAVMMLFSIFMITETFYWVQSELLQGIAFTIFFFAFLSRMERLENLSAVSVSLFVLMIFFIVFFHPFLVIVFLFFAFFMLVDEQFTSSRKLIWASMIAVIIITQIKNKWMILPEYDSNAMLSTQNFHLLYPNYLHLQSNIYFVKDVCSKFYLLPLALVAITFFYIKTNRYKKLVLCYAFTFGYLALINITHPQDVGYYMESLYLPLSIFVLIPLMFDVLPNLSFPVQTATLTLIIIIRIVSIQQAHIPYSQRLDWETDFLRTTENLQQKKLVINEKEIPLDTLKITWGIAYEFWLLSTIQSGTTRSIMISDNPSSIEWALDKNKSFITKWGVFSYSELPSRYFSLSDTSTYTFYHPDR